MGQVRSWLMFRGPPLPLSPDIQLRTLLSYAGTSGPLGAWVRIKVHRLRIHCLRHNPSCLLLVSSDLGYLLGRCSEVALREGERTRVVAADMVIHWRALQVATATPHLPGIRRLLAQFPGMGASANGLLVPLRLVSPEEVLARCAGEGVRVTGSRVIYASRGQAGE